MRRAWRRFWLCHRWDNAPVWAFNLCLRRRGHFRTCRGWERAVSMSDGIHVGPMAVIAHVEQTPRGEVGEQWFDSDVGPPMHGYRNAAGEWTWEPMP